jgi:hypothetical protein
MVWQWLGGFEMVGLPMVGVTQVADNAGIVEGLGIIGNGYLGL